MSNLVAKLIVLVLCMVPVFGAYNSPCFTRHTRPIPSDHLMATKTKPLVIGHRGNPMKYQENTLDGFKSLLQTNADGFELDIYITKDKKLVVYHDDNTQKLTGVNKIMWESTAEELTKINVNKTLKFGENVYDYGKPRPIPMLEDVLKVMKDSGKLMYLEMKPDRLRDMAESKAVGKALAKMVTDMGLVKQAVINSFDPWKTLAAFQENPDIPIGFFYPRQFCDPSASQLIFEIASQLPDMKDCMKPSYNNSDFFKGIFKYGDAVKAINASFIDMDYSLYDNPVCFNNSFQTLRNHYSPSITAGAYTLYALPMNKQVMAGQDGVVDRLVKHGAQRLITDDVDRMLTKIGRPKKPDSPTGKATMEKLSLVIIAIMTILETIVN